MKFHFNAKAGLIIVGARIQGPRGPTPIQMALDTAATGTVISSKIMSLIGYNLQSNIGKARMLTASGIATGVRVAAEKIEVLGQIRHAFPVVCHNFPESSSIEGLLGLDFFRGIELTLDFRAGMIDLK